MKKSGNPRRKPKKRNRDASHEKKLAQQIHAIKRAKERYGLEETDVCHIKYKHKNGLSIFVKPRSNRTQTYKVFYNERWVFFCWDNKRKEISTFLLPEWNEPSGKVLDLIS